MSFSAVAFSAGSWGGQSSHGTGAGSFLRVGVGGSPTGHRSMAPASCGSRSILPFLPKVFLWLWLSSLAAAGQQAVALSLAADEKPISRSCWSSHPSSPAALGTQHSSCLEGKSSPSLSAPMGLGAGQVTLHSCCSKRIWGAGSRSTTSFSPHPSRGFLSHLFALHPEPSTLCPTTGASPQPLPQLPVLPAEFLSGQSLPPIASTPPGLAHWQGWASSS